MVNLKQRKISLMIIIISSSMLILVNVLTLRITSGVRAYVNGESIYSKGQKDGTRYLLMYINTKDNEYWKCFRSALAAPVGDSLARIALINNTDDSEARQGFIAGKNNVADIEAMIWLFRNFKNIPFMKGAIQTWKEADRLVGELIRMGNEIHPNINTLSPENTKRFIGRIEKISAGLTIKQMEFSGGLGVAARQIDQYLFYINVVFTLAIIGSAGNYSSLMIRRLSSVNDRLSRTLDFAGLSSGMIDFEKMELTMSRELLHLLDLNPGVAGKMNFKHFLQSFVIERDRSMLYEKFIGSEHQSRYSGEIEAEFQVLTIKKKNKVLRLKAVLANSKGFAVVEDITIRKQMEMELKLLEREEERRRIANLIEGQEIERARLSREMHDGLGQLLNAVQFNMECLTDKNLFSVKDKVGKLIQETLSESKRISANLLPLKLIDFDLSSCVASLCEQIHSEKVKVVFQTKPYTAEHSEQEKLTLYRIIQEGIQNALKHSGCSHIFVQLYGDDDELHISIEDDGKGFDKSTKVKSSSYGLRNIQHRVEVLNGKFEIESNPEYGTLLSVTIPVNILV
jgi:signal transduction histidine kinase